jgi:hypothetical protein
LAKLISSRQQRALGWHLKASIIAFKKEREKDGERRGRERNSGERWSTWEFVRGGLDCVKN